MAKKNKIELNKRQVGVGNGMGALLWRYFDFQKFISFIIDEALFFNRLDNMEDTNEGISLNQLLYKYGNEVDKKLAHENKLATSRKEMPLLIRQKKYFVSCWLLHHRESVAMWNSYSDSDGIALKISANDLINAVVDNSIISENKDKIRDLYYGKVVYKDFMNQEDRMNFKDEINIIGFQKDLCFEHEKEYRFLFKQDFHLHKEFDIPHIKLRLNEFKKLKFELIFHPKMESWKKTNIKAVVKSIGIKNIKFKDSELQLKEW